MSCFRRRSLVWTVCLGTVLTTACRRPTPVLAVGTKDGIDQRILGEILAQHLAKALPDVQVTRKFGLGNSTLVHSTLLTGEIAVYPEYSGTALFNILKLNPDHGDDPLLDQIREGYRNRFRCEWFGPVGFRNPRVFVIARKVAEKHQLENLTQASAREEGWAIGGGREFRDRPDGMVLLTRGYEMELSAPAQILEDDALFLALANGQLTMAATRATDPRLANPDLVPLADDRKIFPIYDTGFVVRLDQLESQPALAGALKQLYGRITLERMRDMVRRAEKERADPAALAAEFLKSVGL